MMDSMFKKLPLVLDHTLRHLEDRPLTLFEALDQPEGGPELVPYIIFRVGARRIVLVHHFLIVGTQLQFGQAILVEQHHILVIDLDHMDIWNNVLRIDIVVFQTRPRIQLPDNVKIAAHFLQ